MKAEGGRLKAEEGMDSGEACRSSGREAGQGDKETRGQGEAEETMDLSCASSVEWRAVAGAGRPHPGPGYPLAGAEGEGEDANCASSKKCGDFSTASCASSEAEPSGADGQCKMQNAKCKTQNDASGSSAESEALSPKAHELQAKTPASNPKSEIHNPTSAGRSATGESGDESPGVEAEDASPHWMENRCEQIVDVLRTAG
jgi:hypothetical protein